MMTEAGEVTKERHASNLELFVDLVFVFAITQVTSLIARELTWAGVGRGVLVAWLVWWLWSQYVWAGTVLDPETARAALLAGAEFIVSPTLNLDVIRLCKRYDKLVFPGAFTPTEILCAWEAGADIVKVFPADVLGSAYFKAMRGPLPQIRLMPTGGVDLNTAGEFLRAGACCLGVGSQMVDPKAVIREDYEYLRGLAWQFTQAVALARGTELNGHN